MQTILVSSQQNKKTRPLMTFDDLENHRDFVIYFPTNNEIDVFM